MNLPNSGATNYPPVIVQTPGKLPGGRLHNFVGNTYIFNVTALSQSLGDIEIVHVDGFGVFQSAPIGSPADFASVRIQKTIVDDYGPTMRGSVVTYALDHGCRAVHLLPDALGGGLVFVYKHKDTVAASSSLRMLVRVLEWLGFSLEKSPHFLAELLAYDSGGFTPSSYKSIETIPILSYVTFHPDRYEIRSYSNQSSFFEPVTDYDEALDEAVADITANAKALALVPGTKTSQLSAGADSRLVAASLIAGGVAGQFVFYTAPDPVRREQDIAAAVAGHVGLRRTEHPGITTCSEPEDPAMAPIATLVASAGMKSIGPHEGMVASDGLVLLGNYGEHFRSYYSGRFAGGHIPSSKAFRAAVWTPILDDTDAGIIDGRLVEDLDGMMDSSLSRAAALGIRPDAIGDYLFLAHRNRYFVSHTAMETSRYVKQFSTLYSLAGVRLGLSLPLSERSSGLMVFDLFQRLCQPLLEVPFDTPKFGDEVRARRNVPVLKDAQITPSIEFDGRQARRPQPVPSFRYPTVPVTSEHVARAKAIGGVKAKQVATEALARASIRQRISQDHGLPDTVFNLANLERLISRPANTRSRIRTVHRVADYLEWFSV